MKKGPLPRTGDVLARTGGALALLWGAVILALTLHPAESGQALSGPELCLICGEFGLANLLSNVLLFVPLGVGLALAFGPRFWAILPPAFLSAGIEALQLVIPGRNPLPADWAANSLGGALGVLLAAWGWRRLAGPSPEGGGRLVPFISVLGLCAAALVGTAAAYRLVPPEPPHFVQWTPVLGHYETYEGRILEATLDGEPVSDGRHPRPLVLEDRLLGGAPLEVRVEAGAPPDGLAPIFNVFTGKRRELLVLGARGESLVVKPPFLATRLRLARLELGVPGMLAGLEPGDPFRLRLRITGSGVCLAVTEPARGEVCGLRPSLADGWALLLFPASLPAGGRAALGWVWLAGLGLLVGFFALSAGGAVAGAGGLAGVAVLAPLVTGSLAWTPPSQALFLGLATFVGYAGARLLASVREGRGGTTHVADAQQGRSVLSGPSGGRSRGGRKGPSSGSGM